MPRQWLFPPELGSSLLSHRLYLLCSGQTTFELTTPCLTLPTPPITAVTVVAAAYRTPSLPLAGGTALHYCSNSITPARSSVLGLILAGSWRQHCVGPRHQHKGDHFTSVQAERSPCTREDNLQIRGQATGSCQGTADLTEIVLASCIQNTPTIQVSSAAIRNCCLFSLF